MMNTTILPDRFESEVEFSKEDLLAAVDAGLLKVIENHQQHIAVAPCWINDTGSGVMEEINTKVVGRWDAKLQAYVVYAENIRNYNSSAGINEDHRWLLIDVSATFYTFSPENGQQLKGEIKKVGEKSAICMVFDVFTVTVFPNDEAELKGWNVGDQLQFRVTWFQHRRKGPIVRAKSIQDPSNFMKSPKGKKRKRSLTPQFTEDIETSFTTGFEDETMVEDIVDLDPVSPKKKKKYKKNKTKRSDNAEVEPTEDSSGRYVRNIWGNDIDEQEIIEPKLEQLKPSKKKKKRSKEIG